MSINKYCARRFNQAFKELERVLEDNFQNQYSKVDKVLDKIPEFHHLITIKPLVNTNAMQRPKSSKKNRMSTSVF
jgi:hypothetical protein